MKTRTVHRCRECGDESPRWLGRCPACGEWGSLVEVAPALVHPVPLRVAAGPGRAGGSPVPIADVPAADAASTPTGVAELDRVLGGGLVAGSATLLTGEPGMGKSTLLLQVLGGLARRGMRSLLVTAEESCAQVRLRAERIGALAPELLVVSETSLPHALAHVDDCGPALLAVDSIQTVVDPDLPGAPGSVSQVRDCAYRLVQLAKERALPVLLVGHVTKEGTLAGPRVLEHVVDTVLSFGGDRGHSLRTLHALKHRFGSTEELGLFEMTAEGLVDVPDASARFLADRRHGLSGSVVAAAIEGARPLLVEVQALVVGTNAPGRRSGAGLDAGRLAQILAVLEQRAGVRVGSADVYVNVAGGLRVTEPALDLPIALALASAIAARPVAADTVVLGELGLGGEIRSVPQVDRRLAEAARLGFSRALTPSGARGSRALCVVMVEDLAHALDRCFAPGSLAPV
jgi:DNA repair protein RadA/Sms